MTKLLPILKDKNYHKGSDTIYFIEPIFNNELSPLVIYGTDEGNLVKYASANDQEDYNGQIDTIRDEAIANLHQIEVEYEIIDFEDSKIALVQGGEYASEKILDKAFMQKLASELKATLLIAAVPIKGMLLVISFDSPLKFKFPNFVKKYFNDPPTYSISDQTFIIDNGEIVGMGGEETNTDVIDTDKFVISEDKESNYTIELSGDTIEQLTETINSIFQKVLALILQHQKFGGKLTFRIIGALPHDQDLKDKCESYIKQFQDNELLNILITTVLHKKLIIAFYYKEHFITQTLNTEQATKQKAWWQFWK